jgi:hypothetical protein
MCSGGRERGHLLALPGRGKGLLLPRALGAVLMACATAHRHRRPQWPGLCRRPPCMRPASAAAGPTRTTARTPTPRCRHTHTHHQSRARPCMLEATTQPCRCPVQARRDGRNALTHRHTHRHTCTRTHPRQSGHSGVRTPSRLKQMTRQRRRWRPAWSHWHRASCHSGVVGMPVGGDRGVLSELARRGWSGPRGQRGGAGCTQPRSVEASM